MKKPILLLFIMLMALLAACGSSEEVEPTEEAVQAEAKPTAATKAETESKVPMVSGDAITPAETPAEAGVVRDRDWTKGADDPLITIVEYGDFQ